MKRKREEEEGEENQRRPRVEVQGMRNSFGDGGQWLRGAMLGKGSFGSVYLAKLKEPNSRYSCWPSVMAVKSAQVSVSSSLQKEKEVLCNLQGCRYVIGCFGEEISNSDNGGMVYNLLMEYASGGDLASLIKSSNGCRLPDLDIRRHTRSILRGLKHVHDCGYVHCDLKPQNILLVPTCNSEFVSKIGDFGLAKRSKQSKKGRIVPYINGTPHYLSPEVVVENVQEPPADIWALGCVVFEMFTGKHPWDIGEQPLDREVLLRRIANEEEGPIIPDEILEDGKSFLKGCFERKGMNRPTAEVLLSHPFVAGLEEDEDEDTDELKEASSGEENYSSLSVSSYDDFELYDSYIFDDCGSFSKEESLNYCLSGEAWEINSQTISTFSDEPNMRVQQQAVRMKPEERHVVAC